MTAFNGGVHHGAIIDPDLDVIFTHFEADAIPLLILEMDLAAGGVFGGVEVIDVGNANKPPTPATDDEGETAVCGADGEGAGGKEVPALSATGVEAEAVLNPGQAKGVPVARETNAGHGLAGMEGEQVFGDCDWTLVWYCGGGPERKMGSV